MVTVGSILGETFRFARANVRAIAVWGAVLFVTSLLSMLCMKPFYQAQLIAAQTGAPPVPNFGPLLVMIPIMIAVTSILWAGVFRAVLAPGESRYGYLRVGMDELRLFGVILILGVGGYLLFLVLGGLIGVLGTLLGVAIGKGVGLTFGILLGVVLLGAAAWAAVRLSPAGPLTILRHKIIIGPAWRLTRGAFWRLFGAYFVIGLLLCVVYLIAAGIQMGPILGDLLHPEAPGAALRIAQWEVAHYGAGSVPWLLAYALTAAVIGGFALAVHAGVAAVATTQLLDQRGNITGA